MDHNAKALPMWDGWSKARSGIPVYDPWLDAYIADLEQHKNTTFLDLGCGIGANTQYLVERGYSVLAADYSREALRSIEMHIPAAKTQWLDMAQPLPFGNTAFHVIIADISLHYFDEQTTIRLMNEIQRILATDGVLLARVSSMNDTHYGAGSGRELEPRYYDHGGYAQRYFNEADIQRFFGLIGTYKYREAAMTRPEAYYSHPKMLYQIRVTM